MMFFSALACLGIIFNVWLYIDDLKNRNGILDSVNPDEMLQKLMTSPEQNNRRGRDDQEDGDYDMAVDDDIKKSLDVYRTDKGTRDALKRSMAKQSMNNN